MAIATAMIPHRSDEGLITGPESRFPVKVSVFVDFLEDRRSSMEIYADRLITEMALSQPDKWRIEVHRPQVSRTLKVLPMGDPSRMRLARYVSYPWQAWRTRGTLNHVIDQGYGHLALSLGVRNTIITVHDIIPLLRSRGAVPGIVSDRRHFLCEVSFRALRRASYLIADSENTKRDLVRQLSCDSENISVVPLGVSNDFRPRPGDPTARRASLGLRSDNSWLILAFGTNDYKNEETSLAVVKALSAVSRRPVFLVRVGSITSHWTEKVRREGMEGRIIEIPRVESMPELYNAVDCLLFPSWYEGFGLPPIEAMASGTPVVASNAASLPEVVGGAGLMAPPDDVHSLAEAVLQILENSVKREQCIGRGLERARQFTWERSARETLRVYDRVLAGLLRSGTG